MHRFETSILVDQVRQDRRQVSQDPPTGPRRGRPWRAFQRLEKRYFEVGDLGFGVWQAIGANFGMCICNDRRWPETYRVMGLQDVEWCVIGYKTPHHQPAAARARCLSEFHDHLAMQAGAYANATWVVGWPSAGVEEGCG